MVGRPFSSLQHLVDPREYNHIGGLLAVEHGICQVELYLRAGARLNGGIAEQDNKANSVTFAGSTSVRHLVISCHYYAP